MEDIYDIGHHIDLNDVAISDTELALKEFSRGSNALSICLRVMWMYGLKTYSCNPGEKNSFDIGHIEMDIDEDVFSYLSENFITDDKIGLYIQDNRQVIKFMGTKPEKEGLMLMLAREIQSGKKRNIEKILEEKIGKPFPTEWVRRLKSYDSNPNSTYWGEKVYIKKK